VAVSPELEGSSGFCAALLPLISGARLSLPNTGASVSTTGGPEAARVAILAPTGREVPPVHPAAKTIVIGVTSPLMWAKLREARGAAFGVHVSAAVGVPISVHAVRSGEPPKCIGRPLPGTRWRVVDGEGEVAAISAGGALLVDLGEGEVATGERVRLGSNLVFEHLGRTDLRVQLGDGLADPIEIAKALVRHAAVEDVWVSAREDAAGHPRLVAYWVCRRGATYTETELRDCVRAALGDRLVPRMFVELDALPREVTGDVDEKRLASPYAVSRVQEYVPPRTEPERYVASIWQETLGVARIGVYDNFFDLGGHSLLCFRIIKRIESETGKRVSPRIVLLSTLEQVAAQLDVAPAVRQVTPSAAPAPDVSSPDTSHAKRALSWIKGVVRG
jgi:hypothetical protein